MKTKFLFVCLLALSLSFACGQTNLKTFLFIGSYTGGVPAQGIYMYEFNSSTGTLKKVSTVTHITNPSYLTLSPNGHFLYACTDTKIPGAGSVTAFKIDALHGQLTLLNKQPSGGENPVYVSVHKNNRYVINANYTEGTASLFTTNKDGSLNPYSQVLSFSGKSVNELRQEKAHIHSAVFSPGYDFVFFPDLGSDKIRVFKFDSTLTAPLTEESNLDVTSVAGSGPRHFTFHPTKKFAYCIEELSGSISVYTYNMGKLDSIQRILSYSKTQAEYESADIHLSPDGLFLYASNRGDDNTISIFSVDQLNGKLKLLGHQSTYGRHPRNFILDPSGQFLLVANAMTNTVIVFKRNMATGLLTKLESDISVANPSCLQMKTYTLETVADHE